MELHVHCPVTPLLRCDPRMGATTVSVTRNTGQVVAELKVVTSNKLCEPNETDEASSCPKQDMYVFREAEPNKA